MSFLINPFLDVGIRLTLSAAGNLIYYTGSGIWWLGKRVVYGRQLTPEEEAHAERVRLIQQNEDLAEQVRLLREMVMESRQNPDAEDGAGEITRKEAATSIHEAPVSEREEGA
jgi:hypothetical protein